MRKFFKLGNKKSPSPVHRSRRRSLGSFGSIGSADGTPLSSASSSADWDSFLSLGRGGYSLDFGKDKELTKLHKACWTGDLEKVKKHIQKVDVNRKDSESRTPLHLAVVQAHKDVIWFLLGSKAQPNLSDSDGNTPLLKAVQCHNKEIVQFLLDRGADPKCYNNDGDTGLHLSAFSHQQDIALSLIGKGANINAQNKFGMTPLMLATTHRQLEMAELLLRHGASANICNKNQKTCLMIACEEGLTEFVQLCLRHDANLSQKNDMGLNSEDVANISGHGDCATIIRAFRLQNSHESDSKISDHSACVVSSHAAVLTDCEDERGAQFKPSQDDVEFSDGELESWNDASIATASSQELAKESDENVNQGVVNRGIDLTVFFSTSGNSDTVSSIKHERCDTKSDLLNSIMPLSSTCVAQEVHEEKTSTTMKTSEFNFQKNVSDQGSIIISPKSVSQLERDVLAELGLSDISEVSTPCSESSLKDLKFKEDETDTENVDINYCKSDNGFQITEGKGIINKEDVLDSLSKLDDKLKSPKLNEKIIEGEQLKPMPDSHVHILDDCPSATSQSRNFDTSGASSHVSVMSNSPCHKDLNSHCKAVDDGAHGTVKDNFDCSKVTNEQFHNRDGHQQKTALNEYESGSDWDEETDVDNMTTVHMHHTVLAKSVLENSSLMSSRSRQDNASLGNIDMNTTIETNLPDNLPIEDSHGSDDHVRLTSNSKITVPSLPLKNELLLPLSMNGTLGRKGTLQETEEIWECNPCLEISNSNLDAALLKPMKSVDVAYLDENEKLLEFKGKSGIQTGNESNNEFHMEKIKLWENLWVQICGRRGPKNYCDSDEELSASIPLTEEENKDGCFKEPSFQDLSSADDQSSLSLHGDQCYKLLAYILKDPVNIGRVIEMIQYLRLAWQDCLNRNNRLNQAVTFLKDETGKLRNKTWTLNADKVEVTNRLSQVESELESVKHVLSSEKMQQSELEFAFKHKKAELQMLEENLVHELTLRQQSELAIKGAQEELKNLQELFKLQASQPPLVDTGCQTSMASEGGEYIDKNIATETCETMSLELSPLKQKVDYLASINVEEKENRIKAEDNVKELQRQLMECQQNLTCCSLELKIMTTKNEELEQKVYDLLKEKKDFSSKIISTEQKNEKLSNELSLLRCCVEENNAKVSVLQTESEAMKNNELKLKAKLNTKEETNEQMMHTVKDLQNRYTDLQSCYMVTKLELENVSKINSVLKQAETTLQENWEHTFAALHERYEKSEKSLMDCSQAVVVSRNALQNEMFKLQTKVNKLENELMATVNLKAALSEQLKKCQDCADHKDQVIKNLEDEHLMATNTEKNLVQLLEEYKEREVSHMHRIIELEEKQKHYDALKTQVTRLETQQSLARDDVCVAEEKVKELERRLEGEAAFRSELVTLEDALAATQGRLYQADATIDQLNNKLTIQEKEIADERKLCNELKAAVEHLSQVKHVDHELCSELLTKKNMLEIMLEEMNNTNTSVLFPKSLENNDFMPAEKPLHCSQSFHFKRKTPESNNHNVTVNVNGHHNTDDNLHQQNPAIYAHCSAISSQNLYQEDCEVTLPKTVYSTLNDKPGTSKYWLQETFENNEAVLTTELTEQSASKLSYLEKILYELQREVGALKSQTMDHNPADISPASTMELPKQCISLEDLHQQVELLGKELYKEKKARQETESHGSHLEQQLLEMTELLKQMRHLHKIKTVLGDNAGYLNQTDAGLARRQSEIEAKFELNRQMEQINQFLEERSRVYDYLEHLQNERESQRHLEYQRVVRALQLEVRQLSDSLQDREDHQKALDEQYYRLRELSDARKRVKVKLSDSAEFRKRSKHAKHSPTSVLYSPKRKYANMSSNFDYANPSGSSYVFSPSLPSSPIINNLRSTKDFETCVTSKIFDHNFARPSSPGPKMQLGNRSYHQNNDDTALGHDRFSSTKLISRKLSYLP